MAKDKAKLSDVTEQPRNANKHTVRGSAMLEHSIRKNGVISAITTTKKLQTFDGSNTLANCLDIFGDDVEPIFVYSDGSRPVVHVRTDIESIDDPKAKELSVAANRIPEVDLDYDLEILAEIHEEVDLSDMFFADEIAALMEKENQDDEGGTEYQAPEVQPNTKSIDYEPKYAVAIECETEQDQEAAFNTLSEMGYKCKVLTL